MSTGEAAIGVTRRPRMRRTLLGVVPIESPLYAFHPVTRLLSLVVLSVLPIFIDVPEMNMALLIGVIGLLRFGRVDISGLRIYLPLVFMVAFLCSPL